jgi:hypothetical protein
VEGEIGKIVSDYVEVKRRLGKPPKFWEYLETYDNAVIAVVQCLLEFRGNKRTMWIRKMAEEAKRNGESSFKHA